jgi:hypothetical protein
VECTSDEELVRLEPPAFAVFEITNDPFFLGEEMVTKSFDEVRARVATFGDLPPVTDLPDE